MLINNYNNYYSINKMAVQKPKHVADNCLK